MSKNISTAHLKAAVFLIALSLLLTYLPHEAAAKSARCPCFNSMFIAGACGHIDTCSTLDDFSELRCPTDVGIDVDGWIYSAPSSSNGCFVAKFPGRDKVIRRNPLSDAQLMSCMAEIESAAGVLGCLP